MTPTTLASFAAAALILCSFPLHARATVLWTIGQPDNSDSEFAFAPKNYQQATEDSFFVVGESDPKRDWAYAQAGPVDAWAGSRQHTGLIVFGLESALGSGSCVLRLDLLDTHHSHPPVLDVEINGTSFKKAVAPGGGDASIYGNASGAREFLWEIPFPATLLKKGLNEISLRTAEGSWMLYDAISLDAPETAKLAQIPPQTRLAAVEAPPVWLKDNGTPVQPLYLKLRHYGGELPAVVQSRGKRLKELQLKPGIQTVEVRLPANEKPIRELLTILAAGKEIASTNVSITPPRIREMWLLPHSHVDIGYTHRQDEIVQVQIENLRTAMRLARESSTNPPGMRFKWNPEAVWALDNFLQRADAQERQQFLDAVRNGDVGVDGLYGNLLTGLCRPEELAQGLAFGARLSNLTGVPVQSASICDVPGWTWGMVPTMAAAGVKYFAIGPNFRDRVGTIHVWDNKPFYWKSQSGRERILCWVVDNYHFFGDLEPHVMSQVRELESIGFPYDVSFMFWVGRGPGGAVDNAPPDVDLAKKIVAWNEKYACPKAVIGLAGDYFRQFEQKHGSKVPEFSGDLTPYWEDGAGSTSRETGMNRGSADRLVMAETLYALRAPSEQPTADFETAWKNVLLYSEHTWGAWCSISKPDDAFTLDQWRVKQSFALDADRQSRQLLERAIAAGADAPSDPNEFQVFNTTQWKRTEIAVLPREISANSVLDAAGKPLPSQRLSSGELVFLAADVPPYGSKRFRASSAPPSGRGSARAEQSRLSNDILSLAIDPRTGAISSLRLANMAHQFVDGASPVALNDFRYLPGTEAEKAQARGPVTVSVLESGPLVAALQIESSAPGCNKLVTKISVTHGSDRVEIANFVDRKSVREKDGVHFGFGFNVPSGKIHMETPWAVVRPDLDQLPGSCKNWYTVQRWVEIANRDLGITWAPMDAPLVEIGGMTANLLGAVETSKWMTNALDSRTIYSWAQNNHWHTNYKIDQPGMTTFRYVIRPHRGGYTPISAARMGVETTRPLIVAPVGRTDAKPLFEITSGNALVETVKPSTDGKAIIVRLFGVNGKDESVKMAWRKPAPASLWLTDLTEKPLQQIRQNVRVPAYGVIHVRAELRK